MKYLTTITRRSVAPLVFFWLLTATTPCATAQPENENLELSRTGTWDFDFDLFHTLLEYEGLRSRNDELGQRRRGGWNRIFSTPSESVMILTGRLEQVSNWQTFDTFLEQGGVILAASSEPISVHGFFRIDYGPVFSAGPRSGWLEFRDCVRVTDINSSAPIMHDVWTIVTNLSGWIADLDDSLNYSWSTLARLPAGVKPAGTGRRPLMAIARRRNGDNGRLIVIADDSPLSNGMLWHGDNLTLLLNVVRELTRDGRIEFAFLHDGQPVENRVTRLLQEETLRQLPDPAAITQEMLKDLPLEALTDLPPRALADLPAEVLLEIGNTVAARIEDSNVLNEVATNRPRHLADRFYRRSMLFTACAIALAVFVARGFLGAQVPLPWLRQRRRPERPEFAASTTGMAFSQAAGALARDMCRCLTGSEQPQDWKVQLQPNADRWQELYAQSSAPQSTADALALVLSWSTHHDEAKLSRPDFERFGESIHRLKQLQRPPERSGSGLVRT